MTLEVQKVLGGPQDFAYFTIQNVPCKPCCCSIILPATVNPREPALLGELKCCVLLWSGEHDALKSDKQDPAKVVRLSSGMPTYDANQCRHITLTCPPLGS